MLSHQLLCWFTSHTINKHSLFFEVHQFGMGKPSAMKWIEMVQTYHKLVHSSNPAVSVDWQTGIKKHSERTQQCDAAERTTKIREKTQRCCAESLTSYSHPWRTGAWEGPLDAPFFCRDQFTEPSSIQFQVCHVCRLLKVLSHLSCRLLQDKQERYCTTPFSGSKCALFGHVFLSTLP